MRSLLRRLVLVAVHALPCVLVGYLAFRYGYLLKPAYHAAVLGASAALMTIVSAMSGQVFGKLDRLLQDAEKFDVVRTRAVYGYMHDARVRLVVLLFVAGIAGVANAAFAILLPRQEAPTGLALARTIGVGYACAAVILLFSARVAHLYLALDRFRLDLLEAERREEARVKALLELRPSAITPFPRQGTGGDQPLAMSAAR